MDKIQSFRDLIVWQKAMSLVTDVYRLTKGFPNDELYGLSSQLRRSAVSIPSNIAEGFGRSTPLDYSRHLYIARGSLYEMQTQLELSFNLRYMNENKFNELIYRSNEIGKMLNSLISKLNKRKH